MSDLFMKYFVLKPSGTDIYAMASREAMLAYAGVVRHEDEALADRIEQWVSIEQWDAGRSHIKEGGE